MADDAARPAHPGQELLSTEGSVWVHCDDSEQAYLKVMMDEVFGRNNFIATVIWQKIHARNNSAQHFSSDHDYIVVFAKDKNSWSATALTARRPATASSGTPTTIPAGCGVAPISPHPMRTGRASTRSSGRTVTGLSPERGAGGPCPARTSTRWCGTTASGGAATGGAFPSASASRASSTASSPPRSGSTMRWATPRGQEGGHAPLRA